MSFRIPGVPVPKSNYNLDRVSFGGIEDVDENYSDGEEEGDKWMCSSMADVKLNQIEDEQIQSNFANEVKEIKNKYSVQDWMDKIEEKYFDERDDLVRQLFQSAFYDVSDVYSFVLHVIQTAFFDLYSKRIPLPFYAMDELDIWISLKVENQEKVPPLYENHKRQACEYVCRSGYSYLDKMNKLFKLDEPDNSFIACYVPLDNLKSKKLKETVRIIFTLKLQHCFDTKEIALPLIANDQLQVLETYVGEDKELQHQYIDLLNDICKMKENEIEEMLSDLGLKIKDPSKIHHKTIIKIAEKAVKRYNLNPESYPDIFNAKNLASLLYMVKKKLKEEKENPSSSTLVKWDNLIETSVTGNEWLEKQLIKILVSQDEGQAALYWANKLNLPLRRLSPGTRHELKFILKHEQEYCDNDENNEIENEDGSDDIESFITTTTDANKEDWESEIETNAEEQPSYSLSRGFYNSTDETTTEFYQLNLHPDQIILIETKEQLKEAMPILFKKAQVIGFDAEWKPNMCRAGEQDRVSILQLAISDRVYILDLFKMYVEPSSENVLKDFFCCFFTSKQVIKIGYGINGDLKILMGMFAYMKDFILNCQNLVDLCDNTQKVLSHPSIIPYLYPARKAALAEKGLSLLVNKTLGKRLDKTFQVSDWERRPLEKQQLHYAALDAYCLLESFNFLQSVVKQANLKVNLTENIKLKWLKPKPTQGRRKDKFENKVPKMIPDNKPLFKGVPRPSTSLKVVCDTMLQGLGRQLRSCGVDTVVLDTRQEHSAAINISHRENRVILTRGKPFFVLRGHVPEGMCMFIPDGSLKEQIKMVFTRYNISLHTKDIFSRCNMCNSDKYSYVKPVDIKLAYELKNDINNAEMPANQMSPSGTINLSNYTLMTNNTELQLDILTSAQYERAKKEETLDWLFDKVEVFYVCEKCGKVYWEGSHHSKVKVNFSDLLDKREVENDKYFYATPG